VCPWSCARCERAARQRVLTSFFLFVSFLFLFLFFFFFVRGLGAAPRALAEADAETFEEVVCVATGLHPSVTAAASSADTSRMRS